MEDGGYEVLVLTSYLPISTDLTPKIIAVDENYLGSLHMQCDVNEKENEKEGGAV